MRGYVTRAQEHALDRYRAHAVPQPHISVAESLLAFWDRPWSPQAKRFALHALRTALARGYDVLQGDYTP
jgi:hypothetical protein